jgi:cytochrome bd ubiquinol oxidase subunit II
MLATLDVVTLSRLQFALTAIFHMLWPVLSTGLAMQQEAWSFVYTVLLFILSFADLGVMVFAAVIPPSATIFQASSSASSMMFMLTFIGVLIPIMLFYNIYNYIAFRGKVSAE